MNNIKDSIELIKNLSLAFGPSGREDEVRLEIRKIAEQYADTVTSDKLGNLICRISLGKGEPREKIMIAAHMDEVGFMIDGFTEGGMLTFGTVGGIDPSVVAGRKVTLYGTDGQFGGVICSKAIHHKEKDERDNPTEISKLYIDIGATAREEAEKKISIGDFAAFDSEFYEFGKDNKMLKSKALDDRMGCAAMLEIMKALHEARPTPTSPRDIYFCFTVREEIGYSGAYAAATAVAPSLAIVLEATAISDISGTPAHKRVADAGEGVVLSLADRATVYDRDRVERIKALADKKEISAQIKRYVSGGNDAGKIHKALSGIATVAMSVPTRYLHSPACVASIDDYISQRDLAYAIILDYTEN